MDGCLELVVSLTYFTHEDLELNKSLLNMFAQREAA